MNPKVIKLYKMIYSDKDFYSDNAHIYRKKYIVKARGSWAFRVTGSICVDVFSYDLRSGIILLPSEKFWNLDEHD